VRQNLSIPNIEEEQPSQIGEFDHSASIIVPSDNLIDNYEDENKFNGQQFDDELQQKYGNNNDIPK
jgi:hypothetical protein